MQREGGGEGCRWREGVRDAEGVREGRGRGEEGITCWIRD